MNRYKVFRVSDDSELRELRFLDIHHSLPFIIEGDHFTFRNTISDSDIIVVLSATGNDINKQFEVIKKEYKNQLILVFHIYHIEEHFSAENIKGNYEKVFSDLTDRIYVVHTEMTYQGGIHYDWLWNRHKLLFTDYDKFKIGDYNYMDRASKSMYELGDIKPKTWGCRKFLCINRIRRDDYTDRSIRRLFLMEYLKNKDGYVNDPENNIKFISQESVPYYTHTKRNTHTDFKMDAGFGKVHPVHDLYYEDSVFSIYVETLTYFSRAKIRSITEKTWNPLIKGHFILPYGYQGLIKDIESYGFVMPSFINYNYDQYTNDPTRFMKYVEEINRLLDLSNQDLITNNDRNLEILKHNRNVFFTRDYHSLFDKIIDLL